MTEIKNKDDTLMEIGVHCTICRKLDFLPYTCPKCHLSFCSDHRMNYNDHECNALSNSSSSSNSKDRGAAAQLSSSTTLFPNMNRIRQNAALEDKLKSTKLFDKPTSSSSSPQRVGSNPKPKTNTIASRLISNSLIDESAQQALQKLKNFIKFSKKKSSSSSGGSGLSFSGVFKSSSFSSSSSKNRKKSAAQKIVELSKLKQQAKGSPKISVSERVYIYCQYIPEDISTTTTSATKKSDQNAQALYVSKAWPVGRLLDNVSELLKIKNINDKSSTTKSEKLFVFRNKRDDEESQDGDGDEEAFRFIPFSGRVVKEIRDGDHVYIVRGASV